jgi:hypothetical protein
MTIKVLLIAFTARASEQIMKNLEENNIRPVEQKPAKLKYTSPNLKQYGAIHLLTQGSGNVGNDAGAGMMNAGSDRTIKENIVKIGQHPLGIGLYLFDYKPEYRSEYGFGRQFGVMADEVKIVMPAAVSLHPNGYQQVNYAMLGVERSIH